MKIKSLIAIITISISLCFYVFLTEADADELGNIRVGSSYEMSFVMGGQLGDVQFGLENKSPTTDEVFGFGWGGGLELGWRYRKNWEVIFGLAYLRYNADDIILSNDYGDKIEFSFDDLSVIPIYTGLRILFSNEPDKGLVPYLRGNMGAIWMDDLAASLLFMPNTNQFDSDVRDVEWWDSSFRFMFDLGGGLEYIMNNMGFFMEIYSRRFQSPTSGGGVFINDVLFEKQGSTWNPVNVRLGVNYYF